MLKALVLGVVISATTLFAVDSNMPPQQASATQRGKHLSKKEMREYLLSVSVTIECPDGASGSGTFLKDKNNGDIYCISAAHVTRDHKTVKLGQYRYDKNGKERVFWIYGEVVASDPKEDIAIIKAGRFAATASKIYREDEPPEADTPIVHCGSFGDSAVTCHHSITYGTITTVGLPYPGFAYKDQIDMTGWYGSSGSGVFLEDGRYIGTLTHGIPNNGRIIFITPIRRILEWADKNGFSHLFHD